MEHTLIIMQKWEEEIRGIRKEGYVYLVAIKIKSSFAFLRQDEIATYLDKYAEQYAMSREGLEGVYLPLVELE